MIPMDAISHSYHWSYDRGKVGSGFAPLLAMWTRKPKLIRVVPNRRSRKRIVTLKNFRNVLLVALVLFVVVTIRSEMKGNRQGDYGRIVSRELPPPPEAKPMERVTEAPEVRDETSADPMLIQPAIRAQFLGDTTLEPVPLIDPATESPAQHPTLNEGRVVIVGGTDGVSIVRDERPKPPQLGGGFGRQ